MRTIFLIAIGVFLGIGLWELVSHFNPVVIGGTPPASVTVSYVDLVSLMLTGVTILLAILGFGVAILAFLGWQSIGKMASKTGESIMQKSLKPGGGIEPPTRGFSTHMESVVFVG